MPAAKRRPSSTKKSKSSGNRQVQQLRTTVRKLREQLARERRARLLNFRLLAEAKRARDMVRKQVMAMRSQGQKLAKQLRGTLTDSKRRDQARKDALARVAELRKEISRQSDELRRKTSELRKLAQESAGRARDIILGEGPSAKAAAAAAPAAGEEWRADEPEPPFGPDRDITDTDE
jgi:chromosome segregation ATPase